jgi:hypothetical protein
MVGRLSSLKKNVREDEEAWTYFNTEKQIPTAVSYPAFPGSMDLAFDTWINCCDTINH